MHTCYVHVNQTKTRTVTLVQSRVLVLVLEAIKKIPSDTFRYLQIPSGGVLLSFYIQVDEFLFF